jgi:hypothetical protein
MEVRERNESVSANDPLWLRKSVKWFATKQMLVAAVRVEKSSTLQTGARAEFPA